MRTKFYSVVLIVFLVAAEVLGTFLVASSKISSTGLLNPRPLGYAPYAYVAHDNISMYSYMQQTGIKNYFAGFVQSTGKCAASWAGESNRIIGGAAVSSVGNDITRVRNGGGNIMVSFGGKSGMDLASVCNLSDLVRAYTSVIDAYSLTAINFDIEGRTLADAHANTLRTQAAFILQRYHPNLAISLTLVGTTHGLEPKSLGLVQHMHNAGVSLSGIYIMTSDYGSHVTDVGATATQAAMELFAQIKSIYPTVGDATIWQSLGIVPILGINDGIQNPSFTLANARTVHTFAVSKKLGTISAWAANRDKSCRNNAAVMAIDCSGVSQAPNQYANILKY